MRTIPLTQNKFVIVDDDDFHELSKYKWYAHNKGYTFVADRRPRSGESDLTTISMHREILQCRNGFEVDHINGNGLDNRKENLRIVTDRENHQNLHIKKSSNYPGVSWNKQKEQWTAQIRISGKLQFLGSYDDEKSAGIVYAMACNLLKLQSLKPLYPKGWDEVS